MMTELCKLLSQSVMMFAGEALVHHVLSVSLASSPDDDVVFTNVAGFIVMYVLSRAFGLCCAFCIENLRYGHRLI